MYFFFPVNKLQYTGDLGRKIKFNRPMCQYVGSSISVCAYFIRSLIKNSKDFSKKYLPPCVYSEQNVCCKNKDVRAVFVKIDPVPTTARGLPCTCLTVKYGIKEIPAFLSGLNRAKFFLGFLFRKIIQKKQETNSNKIHNNIRVT